MLKAPIAKDGFGIIRNALTTVYELISNLFELICLDIYKVTSQALPKIWAKLK